MLEWRPVYLSSTKKEAHMQTKHCITATIIIAIAAITTWALHKTPHPNTPQHITTTEKKQPLPTTVTPITQNTTPTQNSQTPAPKLWQRMAAGTYPPFKLNIDTDTIIPIILNNDTINKIPPHQLGMPKLYMGLLMVVMMFLLGRGSVSVLLGVILLMVSWFKMMGMMVSVSMLSLNGG